MAINDGSYSIEAAMILPIYVLILLMFININDYIMFNNYSYLNITDVVLQNTKNKYTNDRIFNKSINEKFKMNNKNVKKYNTMYKIEGDKIKINMSYIYTFPLIFLKEKTTKKNITAKSFEKGMGICEYEKYHYEYDIWKLNNLDRAKIINQIMDGFEFFDGSHVDKTTDNEIIAIMSLDYRKESYQNEKNVLTKIKEELKKLLIYKDKNNRKKILILTLPDGNYNASIESVLNIAYNLCIQNDVKFMLKILN